MEGVEIFLIDHLQDAHHYLITNHDSYVMRAGKWYSAITYVSVIEKKTLNFKLYLFYNNNIRLQIGHEVILLGGE